ncbi:spermatogenesis-associated protein 20 [Rhizophlyctis rosea]|nr:spermatogenesis-associated protein 20 [Rhizophlyctis rosea]
MSVWVTPDLKPIFGGTYYAPVDKYGMPGFVTLCEKIHQMWTQNHQKVIQSGDKIIQSLQDAFGHSKDGQSSSTDVLNWRVAEKCYKDFVESFDEKHGGFGGSPKFPTPVFFHFLLRYHAYMNVSDAIFTELSNATTGRLRHLNDKYGLKLTIGNGGLVEVSEIVHAVEQGLKIRKAQSKKALEMVDFTLKVGGWEGINLVDGTDHLWHVPHFEKMLYDQAQLCIAYVETYQCTGDSYHAEIARDIIQYVERDLLSADGGFFSAEDADAYPTHDAKEKKEGAFAVWEQQEIVSILGDENAQVFNSVFGVQPRGNVNPRSDPHGELTEKNVLIQKQSLEEAAQKFEKSVEEVKKILEDGKAKLWDLRKGRPKPHRDDKIITSWNGLIISAIARAYQVLVFAHDAENPDRHYLDLATRAATFFYEKMWDAERKVLRRSFREGPSDVEGFADDYAFLIQGLLDLYEAGFDERWLQWAVELQETQDRLFWDANGGGYYSGSDEDKRILLRMKEDHDGAEPSASSVSLSNLLRLDALAPPTTHEPGTQSPYATKATQLVSAFAETIKRHPQSMASLVGNIPALLRGLKEVVIHGNAEGDKSVKEMVKAVHGVFVPGRSVVLAVKGREGGLVARRSEMVRGILEKGVEEGGAEVFVCRGFECGMPVGRVEEVRGLLLDE